MNTNISWYFLFRVGSVKIPLNTLFISGIYFFLIIFFSWLYFSKYVFFTMNFETCMTSVLYSSISDTFSVCSMRKYFYNYFYKNKDWEILACVLKNITDVQAWFCVTQNPVCFTFNGWINSTLALRSGGDSFVPFLLSQGTIWGPNLPKVLAPSTDGELKVSWVTFSSCRIRLNVYVMLWL